MQIGKQKKDIKKAKVFTIQNLFGEALALANISILNSFSPPNNQKENTIE